MGQFVRKTGLFLKLDLTRNGQLLKVNAYLSTEKRVSRYQKYERNHSPKSSDTTAIRQMSIFRHLRP